MSASKGGLLYVFALTTLHPGVGRGGEHVDLPVQRDEFGYPVIWGSGLKGSLRSYFTRLNKNNEVKTVLGPEPASDEVSEYSSAISVHDARLILLPARSLKGVWIYATSPHLLSYLEIALEALETSNQDMVDKISEALRKLKNKADSLDSGKAILSDKRYLVNADEVFVNERKLTAIIDSELLGLVKSLIPQNLHDKTKGIALLNDEDMSEVVKRSLLVQYRVRLKMDTKTVEPGALWSEEHIPQRTIFVSYVACWPPRAKNVPENLKTPDSIYKFVKRARFINLGGKETVGHGLVRLEWLP